MAGDADLLTQGAEAARGVVERDVGAGAAHVERRDRGVARRRRRPCRSDDATRGSGEQDPHGLARSARCGEAAARTRENVESRPAERLAETVEVALDHRDEGRVAEGRREALGLAILGDEVRGRGRGHPPRAQRLRDASFGAGIPVAVEQADGCAPRAAGRDRVGDAGDLLVGGAPLLHEVPGLDPDGPLTELEAELARRERRGPDGLERVEVRSRLAVDLHEVPEALVRDEGDGRRGPLEQSVEGHGRPVDHSDAAALPGRQPERVEAFEQGAPWVVGGRPHLDHARALAGALEDDVREGASSVDSHAQGADVRGRRREAPGCGRAGFAGHGAECTPARGSAADRRGFTPVGGALVQNARPLAHAP